MCNTYVPALFPTWFRCCHWLMAGSVLGLIVTGWDIYNAAPVFGFRIAMVLTPDLGLSQAIRWHLFLGWLLAIAGLALTLGRFGLARRVPDLRGVSRRQVVCEILDATKLRMKHPVADYLHVQRVLYLGVYGALLLLILSGLALWKPVQFQLFGDFVGGYEVMRQVHFLLMASVAAFFVIHFVMAILAPGALWSMLIGVRPSPKERER